MTETKRTRRPQAKELIEYDYYINGIYQVSGTRKQICKQMGISTQSLKSRLYNTRTKRNNTIHILVEKEK